MHIFKNVSFTCLLISCFILLTNINESHAARAKRGKGEPCLTVLEQIKTICKSYSSNASDLDKKTARKCQALKKKEKTVCSLKRLRCNEYDSLVCGLINPPCKAGGICPAVLSRLQTYNNVCEFKKTASEFQHRGDCFATPTPTPTPVQTPGTDDCTVKSRAVCGQMHFDCIRAPCIQPDPQWYASICALRKAGARLVDDSSCSSKACVPDGRPVCGQPRSNCTDVACTNAQYLPRWYADRCELLKEKAVEVPFDNCSLEDCLSSAPICGTIYPKCVDHGSSDLTNDKLCLDVAPITRWFTNLCELSQQNGEAVSSKLCAEQQ